MREGRDIDGNIEALRLSLEVRALVGQNKHVPVDPRKPT